MAGGGVRKGLFLRFFNLRQQLVQLLEAAFPDLAELFEPFIYLFHFVDFELVIHFAALVFFLYQIALGQDAKVFGHGLPGGVEMFSDGVRGHGLDGDQGDDGATGRVGNGLENISSHLWIFLRK